MSLKHNLLTPSPCSLTFQSCLASQTVLNHFPEREYRITARLDQTNHFELIIATGTCRVRRGTYFHQGFQLHITDKERTPSFGPTCVVSCLSVTCVETLCPPCRLSSGVTAFTSSVPTKLLHSLYFLCKNHTAYCVPSLASFTLHNRPK